MARGGALLVGAHHSDLVASSGCRCRQAADADGKHAVVVADQNPQGLHQGGICVGWNLIVMAAYSDGRDTDALSSTISLQQLTDQLDALTRVSC